MNNSRIIDKSLHCIIRCFVVCSRLCHRDYTSGHSFRLLSATRSKWQGEFLSMNGGLENTGTIWKDPVRLMNIMKRNYNKNVWWLSWVTDCVERGNWQTCALSWWHQRQIGTTANCIVVIVNSSLVIFHAGNFPILTVVYSSVHVHLLHNPAICNTFL